MKNILITTSIILSFITVKAQTDSVKLSYNADGTFDLIKYYNNGKEKLYKLSDRDRDVYDFTNKEAIVLIDLVDEMAKEELKKRHLK
jgi:hypothetical protein